ncbi:MAG: hypothetical protein AAGI03_17955 [Pseudomonadota bacterium]
MEDIGNIDATLFFMAHRFVGKCETRYNLHGVCIEPRPEGGVYMVGTDGCSMGVAYDPHGSIHERCTIRTSAAQQPFNTGRRTAVEYDCCGEDVRWGEGSWPWWHGKRFQLKRLEADGLLGFDPDAGNTSTTVFERISAEFVPWQKAVPWEVLKKPAQHAVLRGVIAVKVMAKVCFSTDNIAEHLTFRQGEDPDSPVIALPKRHPNFFGVVMPDKQTARAETQPWMRALAEANTASGGKGDVGG